jgi:cold shock CspA family protein
MPHGTVAWFDAQRGIGAILIEGSGIEVPVRSTQIDGGGRQSRQQNLRRDTRVACTLPHRPRATHVHIP